jgi:toxin FitB
MIVLDTNIISEVMKPVPEAGVIGWLDQQATLSLWTTSVCVFEIWMGLSLMADGKRRRGLEVRFQGLIEEDLGGRVLPFDTSAAHEAARITAQVQSMGQPIDMRDLFIAGTVSASRGVLATRNTKHFVHTGIKVVNPWESSR